MTLVLRLLVNAVAIWLAVAWVGGLTLSYGDYQDNGHKVLVLLGVAVVFGVVNALVKPIVKLLSLPLLIVTLGLFVLVVNALMLWLTAAITETTEYGLRVSGVWAAIFGALIISLVNWILGMLIPDKD